MSNVYDSKDFEVLGSNQYKELQAECERLRERAYSADLCLDAVTEARRVLREHFGGNMAFLDDDLIRGVVKMTEEVGRLRAELAAAQERLDAVREIYAGMDGFIPQTAPEAYCLRIIREMAYAAMAQEKRDE